MTPLDREPLIAQFATYAPHVDTAILGKAFDFSVRAHENQARASGEIYFVHCQSVATSLVEWKMDLPTICAGLLHDTLEDTPITQEAMRAEFGEEITRLVLGVTKLEHLEYSSRDDVQAENWRKMLLATAQDIRVIVIKLADRLHNMQTLGFLSPERQQRIAHETSALYAPLAHRLGMFQLKSELEDLAFKHLWPKEFSELTDKVNAMLAAREATLKKFKESVEKALADSEIAHRILSRSKSLYSIYGKMQRQKKPFEEIQDALGVRIITDTISNCYALLGIVHTEFKPVAGSFTDYISIP
jgi:GTP pyrophosphokinase